MSWISGLRYQAAIFRREQIYLPVGITGMFFVVVAMFRADAKSIEIAGDYLGAVLPLLAGILACGALVDDPVLELQLAAPRAPWRLLLDRLLVVVGIVAVTAISFQALVALMGVDLARLGNPAVRQLAWLVPTLAMMGLGTVASLAFVRGTGGAMLIGALWIFQVLFHGLMGSHPTAKYVFLFMGALAPDDAALHANQGCLLLASLLAVALGSMLLKKEERYI